MTDSLVGVAVLGSQQPLEGSVGVLGGPHTVTPGRAHRAAQAVHAAAGHRGRAAQLQAHLGLPRLGIVRI